MPGIPTIGGPELLIILAIILLFFGASRVPQLGRSLGQSLREFRKATSEDSDNEPRELKQRREIPHEQEAPATKEARAQAEHEGTRDERRVERA